MIKKYYEMLMLFVDGGEVSRFRLCHKQYTEKDVDMAIALGLIEEIRVNQYGEPVYAITDEGRKYRDE